MDKNFYNLLLENLNLDSIKDTNTIQYGITVERTKFRTFPTYEPPIGSREIRNLIGFKKQEFIL